VSLCPASPTRLFWVLTTHLKCWDNQGREVLGLDPTIRRLRMWDAVIRRVEGVSLGFWGLCSCLRTDSEMLVTVHRARNPLCVLDNAVLQTDYWAPLHLNI